MAKSFWKRNIVAIIFGCVIVFFVLYLSQFSSSAECYPKSYASDFDLHGIVTAKFIDQSNHMYPIIGINDEVEFSCASDKSQFYNFVQVGDSVYKPEESLVVSVYRDSELHLRTLSYHCDN